uniref:pectinesterase n=1 Tax=Cajanus cajan TaxID=3821 RepID=A0A151R0F8_CAJCA|nr:Pectinesterase PPME1 [Cajanus cajan]
MQDGSGEFKTITDAIKSVLDGNAKHVIFYIGVGNYNEKKPKALYGAQQNMSSITFARTAKTYGNSTPRPDEKMVGVQAIVLRISGDKETFYNCKIYGLQDIVCYDRNKHFFKDFLIQGIMDNIFGSAKSIYLKNELRTLNDTKITVIVAQTENNAYIFVHCDVTGTLGRAWMNHPKVLFAYSTMSNVVKKEGWSNNNNPEANKTVRLREYKNTRPGADLKGRSPLAHQLTDEEVKPYLTLGVIERSKWLLPPPTPKI